MGPSQYPRFNDLVAFHKTSPCAIIFIPNINKSIPYLCIVNQIENTKGSRPSLVRPQPCLQTSPPTSLQAVEAETTWERKQL